MSEPKSSRTGSLKKYNRRSWYADPKILIVAIPAFFGCLPAVVTAILNPALVQTFLDFLKNQPTPTAIFMQVSPTLNPTLTNTPTLFSAVAPTATQTVTATNISTLTTPTSCLWIPYLNGVPTSSLSDKNCLNDLKGVGISGDEKRISFFVNGRTVGMYGVCLDISNKDNSQFHVAVSGNIAAARFLVAVGPDPVPGKSSYAFRIQPEIQARQEKEMYIKFIEYTSEGYDKDMDQIQAISSWIYIDDWNFDFVLQFNGSKVNAMMNQTFSEQWQLTSPNRYLCFAYEATPTATQSAQLEVQVKFP